MIGMLIVGSYSIVDTIFIGWSAGELGLASVAVTWPLVMLFGAVGDMLGTGAAIIISQSRGNGDLRRARRSFANMLVWQVVFSAAMTVSVYMWLVDILRLFRRFDELIPGAAVCADFDCRQFGLYAGDGDVVGYPQRRPPGVVDVADDRRPAAECGA